MHITNITDTLGAYVTDIDLRDDVSPQDAAMLKEAFRDRHLLVVRGQDVNEDQQASFVRLFGEPRVNRDGTVHAWISNSREDGLAGGGRLLFHSDGAFKDKPVAGLSLYGYELDEKAAPTVFTNTARAWEDLEPSLREQLAARRAVHVLDFVHDNRHTYYSEVDWATADRARFQVAVHPVAYHDSASGKTALFVNESHTSHFEGMSEEESAPLLDQLIKFQTSPERLYTHHWKLGDLIVWNNVVLQHGRPEPEQGAENETPRTLRRFVLTETWPAEAA